MTKTILIVGVTGGFGAAIATAFSNKGAKVRALHRRPEVGALREDLPGAIDWRAGDALNRADVMNAARDADLIVHAVNPPRYRGWAALSAPVLENVIAAARASGARIVFPGNVYNFGPDAGEVIDERAPQHPLTRKGKIRVALERRLERAQVEGVRSLVVRAGDYFGAPAPSSWLQNVMVKPGRPVRNVVYPGDHHVGHAWAYLPDFARAAAALADREASLAPFDVFHFEGHYFENGVDFAEVIVAVSGGRAKIKTLPWLAVAGAAAFDETLREMLEMRYLWRRPLKLDGSKWRSVMGALPFTPIAQAIEDSLRVLGCLDDLRAYASAPA